MFNPRSSTTRRAGPRPSSLYSSRAGSPLPQRAASPALPASSLHDRPSSPAFSFTSVNREKSIRGRRAPPSEASEAHIADDVLEVQPTTSTQRSLEVGAVLKRDDFSAATVFSPLPRDVVNALENSDPYADAVTSQLDVTTGYAVLLSRTNCYVWNFENRKTSFSTCYAFGCPGTPPKGPQTLPHATLVPRASGREPGLALVSVHGEVKFWDSIASSLTGEERSQTLSIALGVNETVVALKRCDASTLVLATSQSRLFRIGIVSLGGRLQAQVTPFNQQRGILGRLFGGAATPSFRMSSEGIVALAITRPGSSQGGCDMYAVGHRIVQKWRLSDGGSERLLSEQDVGRMIATAVLGASDESINLADEINLEIVDAAARSDAALSVLYSYSQQANRPLSYGVAVLRLPSDQGTFVVTDNDSLDHKAFKDPRPYSTPRLILPNGGPATIVAFPDTLVFCLQTKDTRFEERVVLKDSARNRFLGFGAEDADVEAEGSVAPISCLSAQGGALLVEFSISAARAFADRIANPAQRQTAYDERLQTQLEQAVFFDDSDSTNPLSFAITNFDPSLGNLASVSEKMSASIVASTSRYLAPHVDLRLQLAERFGRLSALIEVLRSNDLIQYLPHRSRCQLCADAQLLAAAMELWRHHNQNVNAMHGAADSTSVLSLAIGDVTAGLGKGSGHDTLRVFFRSHVYAITAVLENLLSRLKAVEPQGANIRTAHIFEINRIVLCAYSAAHRCRQTSGDSYGLDKQTSAEIWTCRAPCLQLLESLFTATERLIRDRTRELGDIIDAEAPYGHGDPVSGSDEQGIQLELKTQLCELARYTLAVYEERISYLGFEPSLERERTHCSGRYRSACPKLMLPLVSIGRADKAFGLAERHRDFRTLTELCLDPKTGSTTAQTQHCLRKFGRDFAFELYQYYVEQDRLKDLLEQGSEWDALLLEFLNATSNHRIAWLHDLKLGRYSEASQTLFAEASREGQLSEREVLLSLGKLAHVAQLSEHHLPIPDEQSKIQQIDDQLDLVSIHEKLANIFRSLLTGRNFSDRTRQNEAIAAGLLQTRQGCTGFSAHYLALAQRVLHGEAVSSEDLIDLLTLKDTTRDQLSDFVLALDVCLRATDLQAARLDTVAASIWRRAILHDDWLAITDTRDISDDEINARLRNTAYYHLFAAVSSDKDRQDLVTPLAELTVPPEKEIIAARFDTGLEHEANSQMVEAFYADLEEEAQQVADLLAGSGEDPENTGATTQVAEWIEEAGKKAKQDGMLFIHGGGAAEAYDDSAEMHE